MQGNDDTSVPNDSSEDMEQLDTKSVTKKPHEVRDTDQNPDKV